MRDAGGPYDEDASHDHRSNGVPCSRRCFCLAGGIVAPRARQLMGILQVMTDPVGLEVAIDGQPVETMKTPFEIAVSAGTHMITVRYAGRKFEQRVDVPLEGKGTVSMSIREDSERAEAQARAARAQAEAQREAARVQAEAQERERRERPDKYRGCMEASDDRYRVCKDRVQIDASGLDACIKAQMADESRCVSKYGF
jgi:hypothetical protein